MVFAVCHTSTLFVKTDNFKEGLYKNFLDFFVSKGGSYHFLGYFLLWYQPQVLLQREDKVDQLRAITNAPTKKQYPYIDSHLKLMLSLNKASEFVSSARRSWTELDQTLIWLTLMVFKWASSGLEITTESQMIFCLSHDFISSGAGQFRDCQTWPTSL